MNKRICDWRHSMAHPRNPPFAHFWLFIHFFIVHFFIFAIYFVYLVCLFIYV